MTAKIVVAKFQSMRIGIERQLCVSHVYKRERTSGMTNLVQIVAQPFELIQNGTIPHPFVKVVWREKNDWYDVSCKNCGASISVHRDWDNKPSLCKSCIEREKGKWYYKSCKNCGTSMKVCRDWDNIPDLCKSCVEKEKAKWYHKSCKNCGTSMKVCKDWDNIPDLCKFCIAKEKAKWYDKSCKHCGTTIKVNREWDKAPDLCKSCLDKERKKWYEVSCECCGNKISVNRDWDNPPKICKNCFSKYAAKDKGCQQCGKSFKLTTKLQIRCHQNGWELPSICPECKNDALLIRGAIGSLRDLFPFALETTIEQRGFLLQTRLLL